MLSASTSARRTFTIVTATLFAAGHYEGGLSNVVATFCFQLVAATWYFKLKTLWPIVGAHDFE
jgi:membrane protease YdiL (CAAX protease family)